jgi:hypothetical protein
VPKRRRSTPPKPKEDAAERARQLAAAKRRAIAAKSLATAVAAILFGVGMSAARAAYAGHSKEPTTPLAAPPRYVKVVQRNLLQAGVVGPAQAPPGAASAAS